jgi:hypothetical protein
MPPEGDKATLEGGLTMSGFVRSVTVTSAATVLSLSLCLGGGAWALTMQQYRHPKTANDLQFNKAYLIGVADGLVAYNMSAEPGLFCPPGLLSKISFEKANDLVMRYAHKASGTADLPLGRVLLFGLRQAYPCPR